MVKIGDRVVSRHFTQQGVEGTVLRPGHGGCWWVLWDTPYQGKLEREYHCDNFKVTTPLTPFEARVRAYISKELNS